MTKGAVKNVSLLRPEDNFRLDGFKNYWGDIRSMLRLNSTLHDSESETTRRLIYNNIRHLTGSAFADYGDDPEKWLAWLEEDDNSGASEARRARADAVAAEGLPSWAIL